MTHHSITWKELFMRTTDIFILLICFTVTAYAQEPVVGHNDPSQYRDSSAHDGTGTLSYCTLLGGRGVFESNFAFFHRGVLNAKSSIGEHNHQGSEEIYFLFDGPSEFTVNGKTTLLPPRSTVLCPLRSSHGVYNPSDRPYEWMNVAVRTDERGGTINYGKDLADQELVSPAPFLWAELDKRMLQERPAAHQGKGTVLSRRVWGMDNFQTKWAFVDHLVLPPDTSIGYHRHDTIEEVYYIIEGTGRMTVDSKTFDVGPGDGILNKFGGSHGLYNNSNADLEIVVIACSKEKGVVDATDLGDDLAGR